MYCKIGSIVLAHMIFALCAVRSSAQEPEIVPEAKLEDTHSNTPYWTELHFTDDSGSFLVLRHFSRKSEPVIEAYEVAKVLRPDASGKQFFTKNLYAPLVGSNIYGKKELDSEIFGKSSAIFRGEGIRLVLNPNGRAFATLSLHTVRLWDIAKGTPIGPAREFGGSVLAAFTKSGKRVLTMTLVSGTGRMSMVRYEVQLWYADSMEPVGEPVKGVAAGIKGPFNHMKTLLWTPDEKFFVSAYGGRNSEAKFVQFWDSKTMQPVDDPLPAVGDYHQFSRDGKTLIVVGKKEMTLWDFEKRQLISKLPTPEIAKKPAPWDQRRALYESRWFAVHPGGTSVLYSKENQVVLWDLNAETPQQKQVLKHANPVYWVDISRDGKLAATAGGGEVLVWNLETGKKVSRIPLKELQQNRLRAMNFSPDGRLLATVNDRDVQLWSLKIGGPP